MNTLTRLWKEEEGQALSEYGLIIGLIAVFCITALTLVGEELSTLFNEVVNGLSGVAPEPE